MRNRARVLVVLLLALGWPLSTAAAPDTTYEGRTYAASVPANGRIVAEAAADSPEPFTQKSSYSSASQGPLVVEAGRAEFEGYRVVSVARLTAGVVRLQNAIHTVEVRGVRSEAVASCETSYSRSRVDEVILNGVPQNLAPGGVTFLPGGFRLIADESGSVRSAAYAEQWTNALRLVGPSGETVAIFGHALARAHGCATFEPGTCTVVPISVATARIGDRAAGGEPEIEVTTPGRTSATADHAWSNGVWTTLRLGYDAFAGASTLTLRGSSYATAPVNGLNPDAVTLVVHAHGGRVDMRDVRLQDLTIPGGFSVEGGTATYILRSPLLHDGYTFDANLALTWNAASPPAPDDLRVRFSTGTCA